MVSSQMVADLSSQNYLLNPSSMPMLSSATGAGLPPQSEMNNLASSSAAENMNDDRQVSAADTKKLVDALNSKKSLDEIGLTVEKAFAHFLTNYKSDNRIVYEARVKHLREASKTTLLVEYPHLLDYDASLANYISEEYPRFEFYLQRALVSVVEQFCPDYVVLQGQLREFFVAFNGLPKTETIRELRSQDVGNLMTIKGTVTRTSIVRPELIEGCFQCVLCKQLYPNVEQQYTYSRPTQCVNPLCNNIDEWDLIVERSKFIDWQKIRIQENANEIPAGSMPRSIDVIVRHEMCEVAKPGDNCLFTGIPVALPDVAQILMAGRHINIQKLSKESGRMNKDNGVGASGFSGLKKLGCREMSYRMAFVANYVSTSQDKYGHFNDEKYLTAANRSEVLASLMTDKERQEVLEMIESPTLYEDLISSIAPSIHGHKKIKEGLLLLLLGGVHKTTPEGTNKLRGDINICIVGDPGLSKSQFLKYVASFLPRGVYTSGKASSAAGLTATVVKDEESGDFTIEAGALMLADNGICCIDEFDKMEIRDQVAIHEAMEQQTISIAKAGIHATLNARTSILAAANPVGGRYDRSKSLKQNVNMSPAIMSRFDLFFVVLDQVNENEDFKLAKHILNVHRDINSAFKPKYSLDAMRRFILFARALSPMLSTEAGKKLAEIYRTLRQTDSQSIGRNGYRITVRQLESLIRLSEAMARAQVAPKITELHVKKAAGLLQSSVVQVEKDDIDIAEDEQMGDSSTQDAHNSIEQEGGGASMNISEESDANVADKQSRKLSFEEFNSIKRWVISLLSQSSTGSLTEEDSAQAQGGMKLSEICEKYLIHIENELNTEQEYVLAYKKINGVLRHLVRKDNTLLPLNAEVNEDGLSVINDETFLVVHPSIDLDTL